MKDKEIVKPCCVPQTHVRVRTRILPYTSFVPGVLFGFSRGVKGTRLLALRTFAFPPPFDHHRSRGANGSDHPSCFCFHDLGTTSITLRAKIDFRFGTLVPHSNPNVYNLFKTPFPAISFPPH